MENQQMEIENVWMIGRSRLFMRKKTVLEPIQSTTEESGEVLFVWSWYLFLEYF